MLFLLFQGVDFRSALINLILTLPIVLISLSVHEMAHGYAAYKLGDRTAFNLGRVSFNPLRHLDPLGALSMLLFGYGWAKPVPINPRKFRDPRRGMAISALAGPLSNLILGTLSVILQCLFSHIIATPTIIEAIFNNEFVFNIAVMIIRFFYFSSIYNFVLMFFNLIPVPPFDGSRIINLILPQKWYFAIMKYERYTLLVVLGLVMVCSQVFNFSPFYWLAEKLIELLCHPINLLFGLIF